MLFLLLCTVSLSVSSLEKCRDEETSDEIPEVVVISGNRFKKFVKTFSIYVKCRLKKIKGNFTKNKGDKNGNQTKLNQINCTNNSDNGLNGGVSISINVPEARGHNINPKELIGVVIVAISVFSVMYTLLKICTKDTQNDDVSENELFISDV